MLQKAAALNPTNPDTLFVLGQQLFIAVIGTEPSRNGEGSSRSNLIMPRPFTISPANWPSPVLQEAQQFQRRFDTLQAQKRIMDRAQTLGNFALSAAAAPRLAASDCPAERRSAGLRGVQRVGSPAQEPRPHLLPFRGPEERTGRTPRSQETHAAGPGHRPGHSLREPRPEITSAARLNFNLLRP